MDISELFQHAWMARYAGDYDKALAMTQQVETLASPHDYAVLGRVEHFYRQFAVDRDDLTTAWGHSEASVSHYRQAGLPDRLAHALRHQAELAQVTGRVELAGSLFREALTLYRAQTHPYAGDLANALRAYGVWLGEHGPEKESREVWQEVRDLYQSVGLEQGVEEAEARLRKWG
ncbi:tetratricopeptide repeat protein [Pontibacter sp. G13]|uniref:tetratricopeptide repeat protein n=1 Tax=Pontibacter sp. G13 TaxID=3074898 RepID=UPI00288929D0|nr:tetratricopeptide repeat protein [Pontibacter sp. G13]WNJ20140.1 tetratricopeptide repeat protein [Pontibacter sp. G13]